MGQRLLRPRRSASLSAKTYLASSLPSQTHSVSGLLEAMLDQSEAGGEIALKERCSCGPYEW